MAFTAVDAEKTQRLGTRVKGPDGKEYIYLAGCSSLAAKDVVCFDEDHATTRVLQATVGRVAVAMAAVASTTDYGWFQIYGKVTGVPVLASFAADTAIFATSTAGSVDDSGTGAEEVIHGMIGRSAISGGTATFELSYPFKLAYTHD